MAPAHDIPFLMREKHVEIQIEWVNERVCTRDDAMTSCHLRTITRRNNKMTKRMISTQRKGAGRMKSETVKTQGVHAQSATGQLEKRPQLADELRLSTTTGSQTQVGSIKLENERPVFLVFPRIVLPRLVFPFGGWYPGQRFCRTNAGAPTGKGHPLYVREPTRARVLTRTSISSYRPPLGARANNARTGADRNPFRKRQ